MEPVGPDEVCEGPEPLPGFADFMELDMPYEDRGAPWRYAYWYWQATGGQDEDMPDPEDFNEEYFPHTEHRRLDTFD